MDWLFETVKNIEQFDNQRNHNSYTIWKIDHVDVENAIFVYIQCIESQIKHADFNSQHAINVSYKLVRLRLLLNGTFMPLNRNVIVAFTVDFFFSRSVVNHPCRTKCISYEIAKFIRIDFNGMENKFVANFITYASLLHWRKTNMKWGGKIL